MHFYLLDIDVGSLERMGILLSPAASSRVAVTDAPPNPWPDLPLIDIPLDDPIIYPFSIGHSHYLH